MTRIRKILWSVALVFVVGAAFVFAVSWSVSEEFIHPEYKPSPRGGLDKYPLPVEEVTFASRDGLKLAGWFVSGSNGAAILLAHGRGTNRVWMLPHADYLHRAGFSVLLLNFRYHGESEGEAETLGAREQGDVAAAVEYLQTRPEVDPERIGVLGGSLGATSAILAAAEMPAIKGVVAQIPFTSINGILCHTFEWFTPWPCFPFAPVTKAIVEFRAGVDLDGVAPIEAIGKISPRPVFLIDEGRDDMFPRDSVEDLYAAAGEPKEFWMVPEAAHGKAWDTEPEEYKRRVLAFWRKTFGMDESSPD